MTRPRRFPAAVAATTAVVALTVGACTDDPGSRADFCEQVAAVPSLEAVLSDFSDADPDVLAERIDQARQAYADLATAAPSAIDSETDDVVALVDEVLDAVEAHPDDPEKAAEQLRAAMDDHPDASAAQAAVSGYAAEECDVRLDPTLSGDTTTTAPATTSTGDVTSTTGG